jgi:hypothetical protein
LDSYFYFRLDEITSGVDISKVQTQTRKTGFLRELVVTFWVYGVQHVGRPECPFKLRGFAILYRDILFKVSRSCPLFPSSFIVLSISSRGGKRISDKRLPVSGLPI